jgi:RHS repeat-associated protein
VNPYATFEYDGLGQRIVQVNNGIPNDGTFDYYYNDQWQLLTEVKDSSVEAIYHWQPHYIDALAVRMRSSDTHFFLQDANFNVTAAVKDDGNAVDERYGYTPYGEPTVLDADFTADSVNDDGYSDIDNRHLYTGREFDWDSGLQLNRHRYYASHLGRWLTQDPIAYWGGLNLFGYVDGMPTYHVDPFGLIWHHQAPWQFIEIFDDIGWDINDPRFGLELSYADHKLLHKRGYNDDWDTFMYQFEDDPEKLKRNKKKLIEFYLEMTDTKNGKYADILRRGRPVRSRYPYESVRRGWKRMSEKVARTAKGQKALQALASLGLVGAMIQPASACLGACEDEHIRLQGALKQLNNNPTQLSCQDVSQALFDYLQCIGLDDGPNALQLYHTFTRTCTEFKSY